MAAKKKSTVEQVQILVIKILLICLILLGVVVLFYKGITKGYAIGYEINTAEPMSPENGVDKLFVVEEDMSKRQCMENLKKAGLIKETYIGLFQEWFYELEIYPGTYTLNTGMSTREILEALNVDPEKETKPAVVPATIGSKEE